MAAVTELTVQANISQLRKELGKIPGITATEAKAMAGQLVKESKKAGKAAEKAAKKSKNAWKGNTTAIGKAADKMKDFKTSIAAAAAPVAAVGAALVAVGTAAFKVAEASSEYIDHLGHGADVAGLSIPNYLALSTTLEAVGASGDDLKPAMARLVDTMYKARQGSKTAVDAFAGLGVEFTDVKGNLRDSGVVIHEVVNAIADLGTKTDRSAAAQAVFGKRTAGAAMRLAGATELIEEFGEVAEGMITPEALAASDAFDKSIARFKLQADAAMISIGTDLTPVITELMDAAVKLAPKLSDLFQDVRGPLEGFINGARIAWGALRDGWDIMSATGQIIQDALLLPMRAAWEAWQKIGEFAGVDMPEIEFLNLDASLEGVTALAEKFGELATGSGHLSRVFKSGWMGGKNAVEETNEELDGVPPRLKNIEKAAKKATDEIKNQNDALMKQWLDAQAYGDEIRKMFAEGVQADLDAHAAFVDNLLSHTAGAAGEISSIAGEFSQRLAEEGTEAAKEQARAAFAIAKAAALSQIVISTAIAAMNIQEKFAAVPPVAAALTAVLMGTSAANMALVATEQPSFHRGGMISPDEVSITAQKGEAVLSRSGVQAAGGESGVNALNSGAAGGGGVMIINQVYRHRVFDRVVSDSIKRTNSPLNKALNAGRRVGMSK